jgi:hypothetical protein
LNASGAQDAAVGSDLEELDCGRCKWHLRLRFQLFDFLDGAVGVDNRHLRLASFARVDDKLAPEVRHEFGILLLLVRSNNLQLFTKQRLELFLQTTTKIYQSSIGY